MKKITFIIIIMMEFIIVPSIVKAESIVTNSGIEMDKLVYDQLIKLYSRDYIETLSKDLYDNIMSSDLTDILVKEYYPNTIMPMGTSHTTNYKTIKITKAGNIITLLLRWTKTPKIKSYDVIGVRTNLKITNYGYKQTYNGGIVNIDANYKSDSTGVGASFKLLNGAGTEVSLTFLVSGSGIVNGSYQHASTTVTLSESQNYKFSASGLGGVFDFPTSIANKYDRMQGVDISV